MIAFYGYNDGRAMAIRNRQVFLRIALRSLIFVIPLTLIGTVRAECLWFISWVFPLFFLFLSITTFFFVKYDDQVFLSGLKLKHLFKVENAKIYKDGKEIKPVSKIKLYQRKDYLFMETSHSYFRIPDDEYVAGSRAELLQAMVVNRDHTVWLRLPPKTEEEIKDMLFREIDLNHKCRLFYSKNKDHIVYIAKREDGFFSVGADRLILANDSEMEFIHAYGRWEPENMGKSVFETEEMAFHEIQTQVSDYEELLFK